MELSDDRWCGRHRFVKAIVEVVDPIGIVDQAEVGASADPIAIVEAAAGLVGPTAVAALAVADPTATVEAETEELVGSTAVAALAIADPIAVQAVEASSVQERLACGFAKVT